jgi:hypothetical protein
VKRVIADICKDVLAGKTPYCEKIKKIMNIGSKIFYEFVRYNL